MGADKESLHVGHRERMRDKLLDNPSILRDHELLEIILYGGVPYKDTNPMAHRLLTAFGNLKGVFAAGEDALRAQPGMTKNAVALLCAFKECKNRMNADESALTIRTPRDAAEYVRQYFDGKETEELLILGLNASGKVKYRQTVSTDGTDHILLNRGEILKKIVTAQPKSVIFCHNHPYGRAIPSKADVTETIAFEKLLSEIDVGLLDHLIIDGDGRIYSMTAGGDLTAE